MICLSGTFCRLLLHGTELSQKRTISTSVKCLRTLGNVQLRSQETNLQKTKHAKYSDEFIMKQAARFKLGKRRLANMMGEDPNTYDDEDVKRSIRYLFPSDLDEDVLPSMKHPSKIFTVQSRVQWDQSGRPLHYLYYTKKPNLYHLLHTIYQYVIDARKVGNMKAKERLSARRIEMTTDGLMRNTGKSEDEDTKLNLEGTRWMTEEELSKEILDGEDVTSLGHKQLIAQLDRLLEEENAYIAKDLIMKLRKQVPVMSILGDINEIEILPDGRKCVEGEGIKKSAVATVKIFSPGTGKITVNGRPFLKHFTFISDRQTVLAPFCFLGLLEKFDVHATIEGGTTSPPTFGCPDREEMPQTKFPSASQAVAMRLAIARSLSSFLTPVEVEMLRRAGMLTQDKRWRERKVYGQHRARKKHTWKRR